MKRNLLFLVVFFVAGLQCVLAQNPTWIGNSFIIANGTWYNGSGSGNANFDGANLGTIAALTLGGEVQDYGNDDGAKNLPTLNYKIDDGEWQSISLDYIKYESKNNWYGLEDASKASAIDISKLPDGNHTIAIYFKACNEVYDSNNSQNYNATFTTGELKTFDLMIIQDTMWTKDGGKVAAWAWESGKGGSWTAFATNNNDTLTLKVPEVADSIIFVRNAPEATSPSWTAWNQIAKSEIAACDTFIITNWNEGVWCKRQDKPEATYKLVGTYCNWNPDTTITQAFAMVNDTLTLTLDSLYGEVKVIEGTDWENSFGAWDAVFELSAGAEAYGMKQGNESQNFKFDADYKNAVFQIYWGKNDQQENRLFFRFVSGEKVEQPAPQTFDLMIIQDTMWTKDGGKVAAWAWESGKEGSWTAFATNNNDTLTLKVPEVADSIIFVRNAPEATSPSWTAWNQIEKSEIAACDTFIITNWNEGVWCKRQDKPEATYKLVGTYCNWNPDTTITQAFAMVNDTLTLTLDSLYGEVKVIEGTDWENSFGAWDAVFELSAGAEAYGMKQGNESQNFKFDADYKNAVFQIYWGKNDQQENRLFFRFVSGEKVEQPAPQTATLTLHAGSWSEDGAKIAAWTWSTDKDGKWSAFFAGENNELKVEIPTTAEKLVFRRFSDKVEEPYWEGNKDDIWGTSEDIVINECLVYFANGYIPESQTLTGQWCNDPTAIQIVEAPMMMQKFIDNGRFYILMNGIRYNACGMRVK